MSWIGPQIPSFAEIEGFLTPFSQEVQGAFGDCDTAKGLIAAHNRYSAWLALFVFSVLGHRPVWDPLCDLESTGAGVAVLDDKVVSERHRYRLVPLPEQLEKQLGLYEDHLAGLSTLLLRGLDNPALARPLGATIYDRVSGSARNLPRILLLDGYGGRAATIGTRPKAVIELTQWPWPLNLGRRLIHSLIGPGGSEWIPHKVPYPALKALLGHQGVGEGGLNDAEHWVSSEQYIQTTRAALETLAGLQGWVPLPGLAHLAPKRLRAPAPDIPRAPHQGMLGPDARASERARGRQQARALAKDLLSAHFDDPSRISRSQLDHLYAALDRLRPACGAATVYHARNLLTRLARYQNRTSLGRIVLREPLARGESPYSRDWPARLARDLKLEEGFLDHLRARGRNTGDVPSQAQRVAEIVMAAAAFDGLAQAQHLRILARSLPEQGVHRSRHLIYVDLKDNDGRLVQRLVPSQVTRALLMGLLRQDAGRTCSKKSVDQELRSLLQTLGVPRNSDPYPILAQTGATIALWRLPPFLMRVRMGRAEHQPLHPTALHRLVTGMALAKSHNAEQETLHRPRVGRLPDIPLGRGRPEESQAHEFRHLLRRELVAAQTKPGSESKRLSPVAARQEIQRRVRDLFAADHTLPPIAVAVAQWTIYLARYGTATKRNLKPATVARYASTVARALMKVGWHYDFYSASESEHEDLYRDALSIPRSDTETAYLTERLREFHSAHCDMHGLEPVDWTGFPSAAPDQGLRYATIVTPPDYEASIDALLQDPYHGERKRLSHAVMVLLGYRLGLRVGEAAKVRVRDLILDSKSGYVGVSVRPSVYAGLKSVASSRMATNFEPLTPGEIVLLQKAIDLADSHADHHRGDPPLHLDADRPKQLLDRSRMLDRIHDALRRATGDSRVRFHTLRHSFVTQAAALLLRGPLQSPLSVIPGLDEAAAAAARRWLADGAGMGYGECRSLTRVVGHAESQTTLANYGHLVEFSACHISSPELPSHAHGYATQIDSRTLRQRKRRTGSYESASDFHCIPEPIGPYTKERQVRMPPLPETRTITLGIIRELTVRSRTGESIEGMARIADLDAEQVRMVLEAGRRITQRSGYPGVPDTALELEIMTGDSSSMAAPNRQSKLLDGLLRNWEGILSGLEVQDREILVAGLSRWLVGYRYSLNAPLLITLDGLRELMATFDVLGVESWQHKLQINSKYSVGSEVLEWIREKGLSISETDFNAAPNQKNRPNAIAWAFYRENGYPSNADFQAAIYAVCTYVVVRWRSIP